MGKHTNQDIHGQRFGRLIPILDTIGNRRQRSWLCECDCGIFTVVKATHLKRGNTKSCGCLRIDSAIATHLKHGYARKVKTGEYGAWESIRKRCYNPSNKGFHNYGGRGIRVCKRWLNSFPNFIADMGRKPTPEHSIDRKDVNGDYEPGNCRWATKKEQMSNKQANAPVTCPNCNHTFVRKPVRRFHIPVGR